MQNDWRSLFPFESRWMTIDGHRMHYVDEGPPNPIATMVLVHGNPTWSFYWRNMIAAWSTRYRVISIDHIGCGLSEKPANGPYLLADRVRHLVEFVETLRLQNVTMIGHDWGGAISTGATQKLRQRVTRLVLMNTGAFRSKKIPFRIAMCRWPILGPIAVRGFNGFLRAALFMAIEHRQAMAEPVKSGYLAPYSSWSERVAIQRFVDDIPMSPNHPSYATLTEIENGLSSMHDLPKLLIWGMKDWCFTPWFLDRFIEFWPEAEVLRIPDAGHWVIEDEPDIVAQRVVDFVG